MPAGWTRYRSEEFGWLVAYPRNWQLLAAASTPQYKYFATIDPKIDTNQRNFNLQPGDGLLTIGVDQPAACAGPVQNPGQTQAPAEVDGVAVVLYHWNPPTPGGGTASEYHFQVTRQSRCYTVGLELLAISRDAEDAIVSGVLSTFAWPVGSR